MKAIRFSALLLLLVMWAPFLQASGIMPLSEVKEGMTGVGRTVFKGSQIEEFQVEILGVLHNFLPQQDLILAVLKGSNLEETGVIAGMSGSPVFIDGKMVGAVSYSWPFSKTPVAGITPIESMLKTQVLPGEQPPVVPPIEIAEYYNFEKLLADQLPSGPGIHTSVPGIGRIQLSPIATPMMVAGFDSKLVERFTPIFADFGWQPMQGGAAAAKDVAEEATVEPGAPISVQLIRGDFDIGVIGTITYRDAEKVLAFGHPFFNLGPIDFPMATAKIYAVIPSLYSSFKVGASGSVVGSIRQDLQSAVFGIMGRRSPMIPITLNLRNEDGTKQSFHFEIVNHNLLSAVLTDFAFQNSILATRLGYSESTLKVSGTIQMNETGPVQINNIFSGASSFVSASQYVASILYTLMTNDFKNVAVREVTLNIESTMKRKEADLEEVWLDKTEVRPGDPVKIRAVYRPFLGEKKVEEFDIKIPNELKAGQIEFIVGGGQELTRWEYKRYGRAYRPDNFDQIVDLLNNLRSNDRIYIKAFRSEPSLIMKGQPLHLLPSSVYSILTSSRTIGGAQQIGTLGLWEDSHPIGYLLNGTKQFTLKILPNDN